MNTGTDVDQTWQAWARGDPLEVVDFLVVIWICMLIPDYFFFFVCHCGIGHLLAFLIQAIVSLCGSWRNDRRRQVNASTTCWDRSDRDLDPDPY